MSKLARIFLALYLVAAGLSAAAQEPLSDLPEGDGKALVEAACVACHQTDIIYSSTGYTYEQWRRLIGGMIALPEPLHSNIVNYLATSFPRTGMREPILVDGDANVTFLEWPVPTLGQRPRDPLMTPDGMIWWAGMYGNIVGRLNPETGETKEYQLPANAYPHSITHDRFGNIWYTGNSNATIGKIDPQTDEITEYPMPDPDARDPHSGIFTESGDYWFTVQNSNKIGRLVPDTGEIRIMDTPTRTARPYGLEEDSNGIIWIAYRGAPAIARVDPDSWEITEIATPNPNPESHHGNYYVRRLSIDSNDIIWYVDSGRGYLGRYDPEADEITEWPTPNGANSHPYAIEVIDDIIWLNESEMRPDVLLRFDPATEKFQSFPIPSGVGIIRNMRATHDGNLVIHQSSTNTVGLVLIDQEAGWTPGPHRP